MKAERRAYLTIGIKLHRPIIVGTLILLCVHLWRIPSFFNTYIFYITKTYNFDIDTTFRRVYLDIDLYLFA